jgi:putrescine transport system permease protein
VSRIAVLASVWAWSVLLLAVPFGIVLAISAADSVDGVPPFALGLSAEAFATILTDGLYRDALLASLRVAGVSTACCLLLGYPAALAIARAPERWRDPLLLGLMVPFWTGFLMRINAWIGLLADDGWLALSLSWLAGGPVRLLYTDAALYLGMVYTYLPFMILPLYASLSRLDPALREAAADLGAPPWVGFLRVTLPLSGPGIVAGCVLVFVPAVGEYVIPELLGGPGAQLVGRVLWSEFFTNRDWPVASALAVTLLLLLLVLPVAVRSAFVGRNSARVE